MLRFKFLVSAVPLIFAAILARVEFFPGSLTWIALGSVTIGIVWAPWHADLHAGFTYDPKVATVRVAISNNAEAADFAVVDDVNAADGNACEATPATQFIAISAPEAGGAPIIYLSHEEGPADYRIFVHSNRFTDRQAAALIVGAHGQPPHLATADL